ncbi:MAG: hypothetical protein WCH07_11650 [Deltaproteobacteria bacterium]
MRMNLWAWLAVTALMMDPILADPPANGTDKDRFTIAGFTLNELMRCYSNSIKPSGEEPKLIMTFESEELKREIRENVFFVEPILLGLSDNAFTNSSFTRVFASGNHSFMQHVSVYALAVTDRRLYYLKDDKQVVDFLQRAHEKIESENMLIRFMTAFAKLRSYDILEKKDFVLSGNAAVYDRQYPDSEWGVKVVRNRNELRGSLTVVTDVYSKIIRRYDFSITSNKKIEMSGVKDLYVGHDVW